MISLADTTRRARRGPSLTPMIDVVFLLLVFFMLAARFGAPDALVLPLAAGTTEAVWDGPPRLIDVSPQEVRLNGQAVALGDLAASLAPLMPDPEAPVVLRPLQDARLQSLVDVLATLGAAGYRNVVIVE